MSGPARVLVVQHERGTGAGWVGQWLTEAGLSLVVSHPYAGDQLKPVTTYDGAVVLGGAMAPTDDERCPWLPAVRALMAEAGAAFLPRGAVAEARLAQVFWGAPAPRWPPDLAACTGREPLL